VEALHVFDVLHELREVFEVAPELVDLRGGGFDADRFLNSLHMGLTRQDICPHGCEHSWPPTARGVLKWAYMDLRPGHATTRSPRYALGPGADLPIARIVAVLLVILPLAALFIATNLYKAAPSEAAKEVGAFNPKTLLADNTPHFLPTPVAA